MLTTIPRNKRAALVNGWQERNHTNRDISAIKNFLADGNPSHLQNTDYYYEARESAKGLNRSWMIEDAQAEAEGEAIKHLLKPKVPNSGKALSRNFADRAPITVSKQRKQAPPKTIKDTSIPSWLVLGKGSKRSKGSK